MQHDNSALDAELSPDVREYLRQREVLVAQRLQEEVRHCEAWNSSQDLLLRRVVEQQTRTEGSLAELQESMAGQGEYMDDILAAMSQSPQKIDRNQSKRTKSRKEEPVEPKAEPPKADDSIQAAVRPEAELFRNAPPAGSGLCQGWFCAALWRDYSGHFGSRLTLLRNSYHRSYAFRGCWGRIGFPAVLRSSSSIRPADDLPADLW